MFFIIITINSFINAIDVISIGKFAWFNFPLGK